MFPAIAQAWREVKQGFGSMPEPLELKASTGIILDLVNAEWNSRNGYRNLSAAWNGGSPSWSGERVTNDASLNHSVVWCCRRIISETLAALPLELMQDKGGSKEPAKDHPIYRMMHDEPNPDQSDLELRELLTDRTVALGNSFGFINRRSGTGVAMELVPIPPESVTGIDRDNKKQLTYHIKDGNSPEKTYTVQRDKPHDILHIRGLGSDGMRGYSVLTMARQSMGTAIAAERFAATFYANGGRVPYNLKLAQTFKTTQDFDKFRADWEEVYSQPNKVPILEPWLEYQQTGMSLADSQFLEQRQFNIPEMCRWFLITPHMVGDLSHGTFSNIENLYLQHLKGCLSGWMRREEKAFWRCLLTPEEKTQGYYFKHNINALMRGDFVSRMAGYASALQNGHMTRDEVRDLEDRNKLPNGAGEQATIQLNMQTLPVAAVDPAEELLKTRAAQEQANPKAA